MTRFETFILALCCLTCARFILTELPHIDQFTWGSGFQFFSSLYLGTTGFYLFYKAMRHD